VATACRTADTDSPFRGQKLISLTLVVLRTSNPLTPERLLEDYDRVSAGLNFARFLLLCGGSTAEARVERNETGVWDTSYLDTLERGYIVRVLSRAHTLLARELTPTVRCVFANHFRGCLVKVRTAEDKFVFQILFRSDLFFSLFFFFFSI
jgi:hypothetical protein